MRAPKGYFSEEAKKIIKREKAQEARRRLKNGYYLDKKGNRVELAGTLVIPGRKNPIVPPCVKVKKFQPG
jgi:hypothetical protein